jgi:hypothetical protein
MELLDSTPTWARMRRNSAAKWMGPTGSSHFHISRMILLLLLLLLEPIFEAETTSGHQDHVDWLAAVVHVLGTHPI